MQLNWSRPLDLFAKTHCRSPHTDDLPEMLAAHSARFAKIYGAFASLTTAWMRLDLYLLAVIALAFCGARADTRPSDAALRGFLGDARSIDNYPVQEPVITCFTPDREFYRSRPRDLKYSGRPGHRFLIRRRRRGHRECGFRDLAGLFWAPDVQYFNGQYHLFGMRYRRLAARFRR